MSTPKEILDVGSSEAKVPFPFRISRAGYDWVDSLARENYPLRRAHVVRACLVVAARHVSEVKALLKEMQK